jgi:hypothetical protein
VFDGKNKMTGQVITLWAQVQCVRREIAMRNRVYARRVQDGKMSQATADKELAEMAAVYETLQRLERAEAELATPSLPLEVNSDR